MVPRSVPQHNCFIATRAAGTLVVSRGLSSFLATNKCRLQRLSALRSRTARPGRKSPSAPPTMQVIDLNESPEEDQLASEEEVRAIAWKNAVVAVIDDFIKAGRNICIGDGKIDLLIPLLDTLDVHLNAQNIIDVAFAATTLPNKRMLQNRELNTDLSVNYKRNIDLYVAPITSIDRDYNVVLDGDDPAADLAAAHLARNTAFLLHEDVISNESKRGISTFPVKLASFMPQASIRRYLLSPALRSVGIDKVAMRPHSTNVVDVTLSDNASPILARDELSRLPVVQAVGIFTATPTTTLVVAPRGGPPYDITSPTSTLANLTKEKRITSLTDERLGEALANLSPWRLLEGTVPSIACNFVFSTVMRADAFVRHIQNVTVISKHHPEIRQSFSSVRVCLTTFDAGGVTELDVLFASELTRVFERLKSDSGGEK